MTYCVAMHLEDGLVFISDSRTNAGIDQISTFAKLFVFSVPGERLIVLQTAGNLATSQSVVNLLRQRTLGSGQHLLNVATLFDATVLVADTLREVVSRDRSKLTAGIDLSSSFIVGGQIAAGPMAIFNVYAQGNFFQATPDTPFLQLGESKYGRPILDRNLDYRTPLDEALRCGLISFDSTIRSNLSVGMPLDLLVYRKNSLESMTRRRINSDDAYYQQIRKQWSDGLKTLLAELPAPPYG
ncbi:TPA: proteasome-type protease [Pseudomonas putida]|jgi:putative proteasome-type protease|uniref:Proteasome-type protease n=2 Tax=Pseudomonas TaxID=286 RepID=B0KGK0_PSEPG|nr:MULTISPECIES: proteasome-type protease [Pseudomonas]ABY99001.1 putative proteasome-type protease [Pseudomonas putida GB-1]APE99237.1 peptidase [Pseudomonas putida]MBP0708791.1 proteasome-type protease [Pseudomonas sp. T34]MCE1001015.1 proteasome-type protease [Pseudomonas sp. NMI1173_11]MCK2188229.1 proteasome-type protease [Pseudomonas sp. MB04B]